MGVDKFGIELTSSLPASKLFKAYSDFDNIAPKAQPDTYKSIKGASGVGSIKTVTYSNGMVLKNKVDVIDKTNLIFGYTFIEGLDHSIETAKHHLKFVPSSNGGTVYKHNMEFKSKGDSKLDKDKIDLVKDFCSKTFKAFESYLKAHPAEA
ncbi:root allergen protein-like [Rutidosis leptorrhynchoides]|uniref:root allergen protein-like n=1 Tax=Rutidosis leptorrhynchoides TaxID=125765 RepID=UPI003A99E77D